MHRCSPQSHPPIAPPAEGWAIPLPGAQVEYRSYCGAPLIPATVVAVDMDDEDRDDGNVWGSPDESGVIRPNPFAPWEARVLLPDPRPNVTLQLDGGFVVVTRAIRYVDSPGWSWPGQSS